MAINPTRGPARETLSRTAAQALEAAKALVHDDRRVRSFFFDGRFLTAKDLTREQGYFLTRQADLSRAGGTGVVRGLRVTAGNDRVTVNLWLGHGLTPGGELVVVPRDLTGIRLDNIPDIQRLDAAFGLSAVPRELARNRHGLYVLALRPVEYTANPIASYPTSLGAARTMHDGDIVEAVALTLVPYPDPVGGGSFDARRSRVAHDIFAGNGMRNLPVDALPLAMLAIDGGVIRWLDEWMVRREVGGEQEAVVGFGVAQRHTREAYVQQYDQQLLDVLHARLAAGQSARLLASEVFFTLPPIGQIPTAAFDPANLTEYFFPPEVDVQLTVIPDDEVGAVLEDCLQLPPIDLTMGAAALESVSVMILVPVPRATMARRTAQLQGLLRSGPIPLRAAAEGVVARRLPGELLVDLQRKWQLLPPQVVGPKNLVDAAWSELLSGTRTVWFARRPNVPSRPQGVGAAVQEPDDDWPSEGDAQTFKQMLLEADLFDEFGTLPGRASTVAIAEIAKGLGDLAKPTKRWQFGAIAADVLRLAVVRLQEIGAVIARYPEDPVGKGLERLDGAAPLSTVPLNVIAGGTRMPELGRYAQGLDNAQFSDFVTRLLAQLNAGKSLDDAFDAAKGA
ncbi:MAG TPA: hypothetical protein VFA20_00945 [Myxococcaceae bacterium]|nr:hypothetical protein [Myxococcaceae bacterium]